MQVFVENKVSMRRRNVAAAFLVASLGIAANNVTIPVAPLNATVNPPAIFNGNINLPQSVPAPVFAERISYQPVNRAAKWFLANVAPTPGGTLAVSIGPLQLGVFAPVIRQATPILHGQDLQYNQDYRELWNPPRRNYAFLLNQGPTLNVNVLPLSLQAFAPTVTLTGTVAPGVLGLTLSLFAPAIIQANSGLVQVPLLQLVLGAPGPDLFLTGSLLVPPPEMTLGFNAPTLTQGPVDGQANLPSVPYISGVGPWDITVRTYG